MVAPREVTEAVRAYREASGASPSPAGQRVLTVLAESGDLSRHLRRVRRELAARRDLVADMLREVGLTVLGDRAGAHVVVPLADADAERHWVATAARVGVGFAGLRRCFAGPASSAGVALGYAAPARRADLERGLRRVLAELE